MFTDALIYCLALSVGNDESEEGILFKLTSTLWFLLAGALLCVAPGAFGQCPAGPPTSNTACMDLTGAGNNVMGNVYIGPYTADINGVATPVICDDFYDDSYLWEQWTAQVIAGSAASTSNTRMAQNTGSGAADYNGLTLTQAYDAVGYLAYDLVQVTSQPGYNQTVAGDIQFALWTIFDPSAMNYAPGQTSAIQGYLNSAVANDGNASYIDQFTVYSPDTNYPQNPALGNGITPPQEFLVDTPEPASLALLSVDFSAVAILVFFLRRRLKPFRG